MTESGDTILDAQTTVDGIMDGVWTFGQELVGRYWWVAVVFGLAFYLRFFGAAYKADDVEVPSAAAFPALGKRLVAYAKSGGKAAFYIGLFAVTGLAWAFDIVSVVAVGIPGGDPFIWGAVSSGVLAASTGIAQMFGIGALPIPPIMEDTILGVGVVQVVFFGCVVYVLLAVVDMFSGMWEPQSENDRGASPPGFPGDGNKSMDEILDDD